MVAQTAVAQTAGPAEPTRERGAPLPAARNAVRLASGTSPAAPREALQDDAAAIGLEPLEEAEAEGFELREAPEEFHDPLDTADVPWTAKQQSHPPARDAAAAIPVRPAGGQWKAARTLQAVDPPQPLPRRAVESHGLEHVHPAHWENPERPAPAAAIEPADELAEDEGDGRDPPEDSESTLRIVGISDVGA
jgi:hypothetical protein